MQTGETTRFTRKRLITSIAVGFLLCLLQKRFIPAESQSDFNRASAQWGVVFLSLAGGYVLFNERDEDLEYYRSKMPATPETMRALQQRRRKLGYIGAGFIAVGLIYLVVLLIRLAK